MNGKDDADVPLVNQAYHIQFFGQRRITCEQQDVVLVFDRSSANLNLSDSVK